MDLKNKSIILTGASSGIGREILNKLKEYDVKIIAVGRNINKIERRDNIIPFSCDISKKEEVDRLFEFAEKKLGNIDIFIANAGFAYCEDLTTPSWEHIEEIFSVNVFSPIYSVEKMRELNKDRKYSAIITCSAVSEVPLPGYSLYCSTKHAINGFGRVYNHETRENEVISLVYPIATKTNFFKNAANRAPIPLPMQDPEKVAIAVIDGIKKDKRFIYPSKFYTISRVLNRILPFVYPIYGGIQRRKFYKWLEGCQPNNMAQ
ncbi:SDR family NAD(P)-dependent oxidoreductase [Clostridium hydrogeniformans]|uniref:SDR family NAD(P)-dependent oxidoreductase n=1 Tax=Clostridium hydrogeniformans TaxID=349933 RepID=UPI0004817B42|nr:SDR family NAD(P)-dependent oxidoreductase [Clostridium hydrogeniformans]